MRKYTSRIYGHARPTWRAYWRRLRDRARAAYLSDRVSDVIANLDRTLARLGTLGVLVLALIIVIRVTQAAHAGVEDLRYGTPRSAIVQMDPNPTDADDRRTAFVALNLDKRIVILQVDGENPEQTRVAEGPYLVGAQAERLPVELEARAVNFDSYPDLVVTVSGEQFIYINENAAFRLITPQERAALETVLDSRR